MTFDFSAIILAFILAFLVVASTERGSLCLLHDTRLNPLKCSLVVSDSYIESVQCHPGLTYIFNFWHSGTLALTAERQSARISEIKNVG